MFADKTTHIDMIEFGRRTNHQEDEEQNRRTTMRRNTRRTSVAGTRMTMTRQRTLSEV